MADEKLLHSGSGVHVHIDDDPKWETDLKAWDALHAEKEKVFFDDVKIANDGGLSEIGEKGLWYSSRYISAVILVVFVFYNVYFIISSDVTMLQDRSELEQGDQVNNGYLISYYMLKQFLPLETAQKFHPMYAIAIMELLMLLFWFFQLGHDIFLAQCRDGHRKWKAVSEICWYDLPKLSMFSAMKLLGFIVPQKLTYDFFNALYYAEGSKSLNVAVIVVTRPFCLIIGLDCFLVKYRQTSDHILLTDHWKWHDLAGGIIFLNQVLGVTDVYSTVKDRLYRYVFAGEDGIMSKAEVVRREVWESFVCYTIFHKYSRLQFWAIMLSWCDDDFQLLTLDEKKIQKPHKKMNTKSNDDGARIIT